MSHLEVIMQNFSPFQTDWAKDFPLQVVAENAEIVDEVFQDQRIRDLIENHKNHIIVIHVTDQKFYTSYDYVFKCQVRVPSDKIQSKQMLKDLMFMADYFCKIKIKF